MAKDMTRPVRVYPVIHHLSRELSLEQARLAQRCASAGVFLISHLGQDKEVLDVAWELKQAVKAAGLEVGVNLLSTPAALAIELAREAGLDMLWADHMGVDSSGLSAEGHACAQQARQGGLRLFASVAFKYQAREANPPEAARQAFAAGFVPTTSGKGTGHAPELEKIVRMSEQCEGQLAVASGMTPENIAEFAPYLSDVLVATGVSLDEYRIDEFRLRLLVQSTKLIAGKGKPL